MGKGFAASFLLLYIVSPFGMVAAAEAQSSPADYRNAEKLFASGKYKEAILLYKKALVSPPAGVTAGDIHSKIGYSYVSLGSFKNALEEYRKAIEGQDVSKRPETQYWIGFCTFLLGKDAEAVSEFLKIPARYPDSDRWVSTAYYWAGRASERMGRKDQAAAYYKKAGGGGSSTHGRHALKRAEAMKQSKPADAVGR